MLNALRPIGLKTRHLKLISEYSNTYTKDRLRLEEIAANIKTLSLETLTLKLEGKPKEEDKPAPASPA